ncbi:MAG: alpha-galactosidase [Clostridia bacterium]|nr:alpha-galactosidase [Clostridia bacterium]
MKEIFSRQLVGDTVLLYVKQHNIISLIIVPEKKEKNIDISTEECFDGLIQLYLTGDTNFANYSSGQTMRNSSTANSFRIKKQTVNENELEKTVETSFCDGKNLTVKNIIIFDKKTGGLKTYNVLKNERAEDICVEMFASFSISGLSPYKTNADDMYIYRTFGNWSAEGRPECRKIESAGLEQSWANYGLRTEKFGAIGSMPVQRYFPFVCIEDRTNDTFWGVMTEAPYSWQIEVNRFNRYISLSGGVADFDYGHYRKILKNGEELKTKTAYITVCSGGIDEVYNRLRRAINVADHSDKEKELPVIYNEYCDSWGGPTHERILKAAEAVKRLGAEYFVIDAGWYCDSPQKWSISVGDFNENIKAFPYTIAETAKKIREIGMIPGIWFEFECVATLAEAFKDETMFLHRDGNRIVSGNRGFLDFRQEKVRSHLKEKVIDFLRVNGFGYVKIDYNECIGIGCDGAESYGAGLAEHIEAVMDFIGEIRREIPEIVIEACASGGHRIEPAFLSVADMTSFSDAHEGYEGAVVAANVNKLCPTRKNQIWAVVNNKYTLSGIRYSLAKTLFGRLCLSGDIIDLTENRLKIVKEFITLYNKVKYILKDDNNFYFGNTDLKYLDLEGAQAVLKISADGIGALIVAHGFKNAGMIAVSHVGLENYEIEDIFASDTAVIEKTGGTVAIQTGNFDACVIHMVKCNK